jgi:LPLT family lysophospholipid transporter-like MFS transporter
MNKKNYPLLLGGQFLSAFGDQAILAIILGPLLFLKESHAISDAEMRHWNIIYTALLFVPCVVFAPLAGFLNDRFPKSACLVAGNAVKLAGAILCAAGLAWGGWALGAGYFVIGVGTCLYGPAKYGALPEILPREKLVSGNGMVEMLTLLAILGGFIGGSVLADQFRDWMLAPHGIVVAIYAASLALNALMSRTPHNADVQLARSAGEFFGHLRDLLTVPRLRLMLMGTALFWVVGAAMKSHFQPWGQGVLGLKTNTDVSMLALALSLGVMGGSLLAGRFFKVGDLRGVPRMGFALAAVFVAAWTVGGGAGAWVEPQVMLGGVTLVLPVSALLIVAGVFAGLFLIPLNAALQDESNPAKLGKTVAVQNLFDYLGMCGAVLYLWLANVAGVSLRGVFIGLAVLVAAVALWMLRSGILTPRTRAENSGGK